MNSHNVIVVDDEVNICRSIEACLSSEDYLVDICQSQQQALLLMQQNLYDVAIIDIRIGQASGIELFKTMRQEQIDTPVIFISGNASLAEAAQTHKMGAFDFIEKPFDADKLLLTVRNCLEFKRLKDRVKQLEDTQQQDRLLGDHALMCTLRQDIAKVAPSEVAVMIKGESGTGKELIAHSIHAQSKRADKPLVCVNCSAIPENLIESALFGHAKGAFSGADKNKKGYFEMAHHGSLFLDEIADMPLSAQSSLLRALENKEIQKVGSDTITKVDVRLLAASHKDLKQLIKDGLFREDLYYRLNVIPIESPSLRNRSSDIPMLVNYFVELTCKKNGFALKSVAPECYPILKKYHWPGNVRELLNTVERMLIMGGDILTKVDIPSEITGTTNSIYQDSDDLSLKEFRQKMERDFIVSKLKKYHGNISQVAKSLQVDRSYLHKKMTMLDIKRSHEFE